MKKNAPSAKTTKATTDAPVDDPNEKPYPGYAREVAALNAKVARANSIALANPLPGPLRAAFAGDPPSLYGFTFQPVRMGLHTLLLKISSPLLEVVRILREELAMPAEDAAMTSAEQEQARLARLAKANARIATEVKASNEQLAETVYLFVTPVEKSRALLAQGLDVFREMAMREVADKLTLPQFAEMQQQVSAWYAASFATAVQYEAAKGPDDTGFPLPPASATASAGGSPSSAR